MDIKTASMGDQGGTVAGISKGNECTGCNMEVKQRDKAISCDICMVWFHTECVKINPTNYTAIKKISSVSGFQMAV